MSPRRFGGRGIGAAHPHTGADRRRPLAFPLRAPYALTIFSRPSATPLVALRVSTTSREAATTAW